MKWCEFDTYMIYNEAKKIAVEWTVYGDEVKYFLSQEFEYDEDFCEYEGDKHTLINEEITKFNTLDSLIKRTKDMVR